MEDVRTHSRPVKAVFDQLYGLVNTLMAHFDMQFWSGLNFSGNTSCFCFLGDILRKSNP